MEDKLYQFTIGEDTLTLIVEAILTKVKALMGNISGLTEEGLGEEKWAKLVKAILTDGDTSDLEIDADTSVSLELLNAVITGASEGMSYKIVVGEDINTVVPAPASNVLYILKPDADTNTNVSLWVWAEANEDGAEAHWIGSGGLEIPDFNVINTEDPDHVANVVGHILAGNDKYNSSANVRGRDIINVKGLTQILVKLNYGTKIAVPYDAATHKPVAEMFPRPNMNAFYIVQESEDEKDWVAYTPVAVPTGEEDETKIVWVTVGNGASGGSAPDIELPSNLEEILKNYWRKDEIEPLTEEKIKAIVDAAAERVGFLG